MEGYVGIDVSKNKLAVAIAGGERGDEVLSLGTFENTPASVDKLLKKLAGRGDISACYEAGPTGYGRCRQIRAAGCECCVMGGSINAPGRGRCVIGAAADPGVRSPGAPDRASGDASGRSKRPGYRLREFLLWARRPSKAASPRRV